MEKITRLRTLMSRDGLKQVLIDRSKNGDKYATKALNLSKHFNDLRYYGVKTYLTNQFTPTIPFDTHQSETIENPTNASSSNPFISNSTLLSKSSLSSSPMSTSSKQYPPPQPPRSAKVALMITTVQKQLLHDDLGFSESEIKDFTPVVAHRLIGFKVSRSDVVGGIESVVTKSDNESESDDSTILTRAQIELHLQPYVKIEDDKRIKEELEYKIFQENEAKKVKELQDTRDVERENGASKSYYGLYVNGTREFLFHSSDEAENVKVFYEKQFEFSLEGKRKTLEIKRIVDGGEGKLVDYLVD